MSSLYGGGNGGIYWLRNVFDELVENRDLIPDPACSSTLSYLPICCTTGTDRCAMDPLPPKNRHNMLNCPTQLNIFHVLFCLKVKSF